MKKLFTLLILLFLMSASSWAAVSTYTFASSSGTFTPISGGTVIAPAGVYFDDNVYNANPIGFNFIFNGSVHYLFSVNANGWLCMGSTAVSSYSPISGGTSNNVISAIGADQSSAASNLSTIEYKLVGTAPNRVLVVQFLHLGKWVSSPGHLEDYNYQIRLYETTNVVEIVYGTMTVTGSSSFQVGLRGTATTDYNNRTTSTNWAATTAGASSSATCTLSSTILPASGLTYTFTPPAPTTTPAAPISLSFSAVTAGGMTLNWVDNSTDETNFTIYRALDAGFTTGMVETVVPSTTTAATGGAYNSILTGLNPSTIYYFSIIAANDGAYSADLKGNQATTAPATISSTTMGGLWNSTATWVGGVIPVSYDNVTIAAGSTVVVNQSVTCLDLTIEGNLQWITTTTPSSTTNVLQASNITINSGGYLYAHATVAAGAYLKVTGNFTNNGWANLAVPSSFLVFNGTTGTQTLGGTGTFLADQTGRGIIQNLFFNSLGACTISTTQDLVTMNLAHTAGSLATNNKLSIDNTAVSFGGLINRSVATVTVNNMGTGYTSAPTVTFTAAPAGGITATGVANFDVATGTIRSITITNAGDGYRVAPTFTFGGGGGTGLAAVAALYQSLSSGAVAQSQKSAIATITGGININSSQGVGSVFATNGGTGYTSAPTVGFALPVSFINLVTNGGSGYTSAPTVAFSGGGGITQATGTAVVCRGQVVSVHITAGGTGYTSVPTITFTGGGGTGATAEVPVAMLPTATATIDATLGMITNFTVTNPGYGYLLSFPAVAVTGGGGTGAVVVARHGVYNLIYNYFLPATANGIHNESAVIPANRRIHALTLGTATGFGASFTSDLTLYGLAPLPTFTGNLNMNGNTLTFEHPSYLGTAAGTTNYVTNANITYKLLGSASAQTKTFPFNSYDGVSGFTNYVASLGNAPAVATDGSTIMSITGSQAAAPTGTNMIGTRTFRLQTAGLYGTNPTVKMTWNAVDALVADASYFTIAQATATSGPWTIRSVPSGTGLINPAGGNRTTATATVGPIVPTGDDYFGWNYAAPSCPAPSAGTTTGVTATSAILNWTNGASEVLWNVKYNAGSFDPLTAGTLIAGINAHPYTLNPPLSAATSYVWYVQADCGGGLTSTWTGPYTFTTLCATVSLPVNQGFNSALIPSCWAQQYVSGTLGFTFPTTGTGTPAPTPFEGTNQVMYNSYYNSTSTRLVTPPINSTGISSVDAQFQWYFSTNGGATSYLTEGVQLQYSTDGTTWNNVGSLIRRYGATGGWALQTATLPAGAGNQPTLFVGFLFTGNGGYDSYLDAVQISQTPTCPAPTALTATSITDVSAILGWTASATNYDIELIPAASSPTGVPTYTAVSNPYTATGLTANTAYKYYVRGNCILPDQSTWAGPFAFTTLCSATSSFSENFDAVTAPALPSCWSKYISPAQSFATVGTYTSLPYSSPNSVQLYSYGATLPADAPLLITPKVSNLNAGTYQLRFFAKGASTNLSVIVGTMTDPLNAATFTPFATVTGLNTSTYSEKVVSFATYAGTDTYIAFAHPLTTTYSYVYLDNITWELIPPCPAPSALTAVVGNTFANLSWTPNGSAALWNVKYDVGTFDPTSAGTPVNGLGSPGTAITGLTPSTGYTYYVQSDCGFGTLSTWAGPYPFTTLVACPAPTTLNVSGLLTTSAKLGWTEIGTAAAWDIELILAGGTFTGTPTVTATADNPYNAGGLTSATSYSFKVRSSCSPTEQSLWAGPFTFTTLCEVATVPTAIQNFAGTTFAPVCWTKLTGLLAAPSTLIAGGNWIQDDWQNVTSPVNKAARLNIYGSTVTSWLTSPEINLGAGSATVRLEFDLTLNAYGTSNVPGTTGTDDKFAVVISTDGGATWSSANTLRLWDNAGSTFVYNNINYLGEHITIPLAGYTGTVKIGFYGETTVSNADNDLMIDNVIVQEPPTCLPVTGVTATSVTNNSAQIAWTGASTVQIEYGAVGHTAGTGTIVPNVTANPYTLAGLTNGTAYEVYVRQDCGVNGFSSWTASPVSFTTALCAPADQCNYTVEMTDAYGDGWDGTVLGFRQGGVIVGTFGSTFTSGAGPVVVSVPLCTAQATDIVVVNLGSYTSEKAFIVTDPFGVVVYSRAAGSTFTASTVFTTFTTNCTPPSCFPPTGLTASISTTSDATLAWTPVGTSTNWIVEWGPTGFVNGSGTIVNVSGTPTTVLSGLTPGAKYDYYVMTDCGGNGLSVWSLVKTFRPHFFDCPGGSLPELEVCGTDGNGGCNSAIPVFEAITLGDTKCGTGYFDGSNRDTDWYEFTLSATTAVTLTATSDYDQLIGFVAAPCPATAFLYSATSLAGVQATLSATLSAGTYYAFMAPQFTGQFTCGEADRYKMTLTGTACLFQPTALAAAAITTTSADLSWTSAGGAKWEIQYGAPGFTLGTGTVVSNLLVPAYQLTGLSASSSYQYYVRTDCGGGDYSVWSLPYTFNTLCDDVPLPWSEGFEAAATPALPACWFKENGDWITVTNPGSTYDADARTGANFLRDAWSATNEYIWTPGFALTAGASYDFSFWWAGDGYDEWDGDVFVNNSQSSVGATALGAPFVSFTDLTTTTYQQVTRTFTPATSGTYHFAIRVNGSGNPWYLSFDDFSVVSLAKTLNVNLFLEGLYNAGLGQMNQAQDVGPTPKFAAPIADKVTIELHDATAPYAVAYTYADVDLLVDGSVDITNIPGAITGSYYLVVKHRNSIEVWSATAIDFTAAGPFLYDFTTAATQAYKDLSDPNAPLKSMGGIFAIYGGDFNQDAIVDGSDMAAIDNASTALLQGYFPEDVNGDGQVDGSDMAMIDNNSTLVIKTQKP